MFGSPKPVVISYGSRRPRRRVPAWLLWLAAGVVAGAGGLWWAQERFLPPRLSAPETRDLRSAYDQADAERKSLAIQLAATTQRLDASLATTQRQEAELAAPRAAAERARDELNAVIAALPPDPRGGAVEVRAARFAAQGGALVHDVVLTRERDAAKPLSGVMQLSVLGLTARGAESTVTLDPVKLALGAHAVVRGRLPLPEGFRPRQVTVQVLDAPGGKLLGMRVLLVK
jgi:hypothetical protein